MGFMDKAKQMADQAQQKIEDAQKQFNESQSQKSQGQGEACRALRQQRPPHPGAPRRAVPAGSRLARRRGHPGSGPGGPRPSPQAPAAEEPAAETPQPAPEVKDGVNAAPDPFKPIQ